MHPWMAIYVVGMLMGPGPGSLAASMQVSAETVVEQAYEQWNTSLGVRQSCSSGASIVFAALPARRAEYRTATQQVVIDLGDSAEGVAGIVIHELSHHTFVLCGAYADADFTKSFYAAQGLPDGRDWFDYSAGWSQTPAEHFAEAMSLTISGSGEGGIEIGSETVDVLSRWLAGAPTVPSTIGTYDPVPYSNNGMSGTHTASDDRSDSPPRDTTLPQP